MIRAAFATGDGVSINRHFGTAERFDVYEIDLLAKTYELVDVRHVDSLGISLQHDDSLIARLVDAVEDCNVVFSAKSGQHARVALYEKKVQSTDIEREVKFVLDKLLTSRISILAPKLEPLITYYTSTGNGYSFTTYKLSDYTDELASRHSSHTKYGNNVTPSAIRALYEKTISEEFRTN